MQQEYIKYKKGFTLIEVVLAIGVLSLAVMSMLGIFAPTMESVRGVIDSNQAIAAADDVDAYIDSMEFDEAVRLVGSDTKPGFLYVIPYTQGTLSQTVAGNKVESMVTEQIKDVERIKSDLSKVEGAFFRAEISKMKDESGSVLEVYKKIREGKEAYLPMMVRMYVIDYANPRKRLNDTPVFSYPTAKLR